MRPRLAGALRHRHLFLGRAGRAGQTPVAPGSYPGAGLRLERGGRPGHERSTPAVLPGDGDLMADFITRLAERALGVAPVVQPVMPSMFAPEPTSHSTGLEQDSEATTSPGDLDRPRAPSVQETPPAVDTPTGRPADGVMAQQEDQS